MTPLLLAGLAVAGGAGAAARLVVDGLVKDAVGARLPWGTAAINLAGSFLLGLLTGVVAQGAPAALLAVLGTGLLGGFTTFSTASVETVRLLQQRRSAAAVGYAAGVLVLAVALAWAGVALTAG
jgi:CrcB protein